MNPIVLNEQVKLQPSWLGKLDFNKYGVSGKPNTTPNTNTYDIGNIGNIGKIGNICDNQSVMFYNDRKELGKKYNRSTYLDEYIDLSYNISRVSRYLLGYRDFHRYYLKPVILLDLPCADDNLDIPDSNISRKSNYSNKSTQFKFTDDEPNLNNTETQYQDYNWTNHRQRKKLDDHIDDPIDDPIDNYNEN